jgi:MSHA biogenesis protein MshE
MLRQDPDILMVGEIRDTETASIAMRAAITGHLVLATLHTNDAITSAMRLIDMGVEGYMVTSAIKGIVGQRLVRNLCKKCAVEEELKPQEKIWLETMGVDTSQPFKGPKGCSHCNQRGYHGRTGVYELLEFNMDMLSALRANDHNGFVKAALSCPDYRPLSVSVIDLLTKGLTSVSESMRIIGQLDEESLGEKTRIS